MDAASSVLTALSQHLHFSASRAGLADRQEAGHADKARAALLTARTSASAAALSASRSARELYASPPTNLSAVSRLPRDTGPASHKHLSSTRCLDWRFCAKESPVHLRGNHTSASSPPMPRCKTAEATLSITSPGSMPRRCASAAPACATAVARGASDAVVTRYSSGESSAAAT